MIVASAIKTQDGSVFPGMRHGDAFRLAKQLNVEKVKCISSIQGFITDKLVFLTRSEALEEAIKCNQLITDKIAGELESEDLW